ncbi:hypothetical protein K438DRAFT_816342 [Mycena galopus ATCC 62051]|nr:hypothetical protein K438DRAFT_816342 [Mycena galopus ATCC 62051]
MRSWKKRKQRSLLQEAHKDNYLTLCYGECVNHELHYYALRRDQAQCLPRRTRSSLPPWAGRETTMGIFSRMTATGGYSARSRPACISKFNFVLVFSLNDDPERRSAHLPRRPRTCGFTWTQSREARISLHLRPRMAHFAFDASHTQFLRRETPVRRENSARVQIVALLAGGGVFPWEDGQGFRKWIEYVHASLGPHKAR